MSGKRRGTIALKKTERKKERVHYMLLIWSTLKMLMASLMRQIKSIRYLNPIHVVARRQRRMYFTEDNGHIPVRPRWGERVMDLFRSDFKRQKHLLLWVRATIPQYQIDNFCAAWNDGIALCALLESVVPGACPGYTNMQHHNIITNCRLGIRLAEQCLKLPKNMITPEEMAIADRRTERKVFYFICAIKWLSEQRDPDLRDVIVPLEEQPQCQVRGSGLSTGITGRKSRFTMHVTDVYRIRDIGIHIRGPRHEDYSERIVNVVNSTLNPKLENTSKTSMRDTVICNKRDIKSSVNQKKLSTSEQVLGYLDDGFGNIFLRVTNQVKTPVDDPTNDMYMCTCTCTGQGQFLFTFVPIYAGIHTISIRLGKQHVGGSPFKVKVYQPCDIKQRNMNENKDKFFILDTLSMGSIEELGATFEKDGKNQTTVRGDTDQQGDDLKSQKKNEKAKLKRQYTIRKRRVLRKVITKNGEEIIVQDESLIPASMSRQTSLNTDSSDMTEDERANTNRTETDTDGMETKPMKRAQSHTSGMCTGNVVSSIWCQSDRNVNSGGMKQEKTDIEDNKRKERKEHDMDPSKLAEKSNGDTKNISPFQNTEKNTDNTMNQSHTHCKNQNINEQNPPVPEESKCREIIPNVKSWSGEHISDILKDTILEDESENELPPSDIISHQESFDSSESTCGVLKLNEYNELLLKQASCGISNRPVSRRRLSAPSVIQQMHVCRSSPTGMESNLSTPGWATTSSISDDATSSLSSVSAFTGWSDGNTPDGIISDDITSALFSFSAFTGGRCGDTTEGKTSMSDIIQDSSTIAETTSQYIKGSHTDAIKTNEKQDNSVQEILDHIDESLPNIENVRTYSSFRPTNGDMFFTFPGIDSKSLKSAPSQIHQGDILNKLHNDSTSRFNPKETNPTRAQEYDHIDKISDDPVHSVDEILSRRIQQAPIVTIQRENSTPSLIAVGTATMSLPTTLTPGSTALAHSINGSGSHIDNDNGATKQGNRLDVSSARCRSNIGGTTFLDGLDISDREWDRTRRNSDTSIQTPNTTLMTFRTIPSFESAVCLPSNVTVVIPTPYRDKCIQVNESDITAATGWALRVSCLRIIRKRLCIKMPSEMDSILKRPSTNPTDTWSDTGSGVSVVHNAVQPGRIETRIPEGNVLLNDARMMPQRRHTRQSTTDTVDSGIADDNTLSSTRFACGNRHSFLSGHRRLHRKPYRGVIHLDPKLVRSSSNPDATLEEDERYSTHLQNQTQVTDKIDSKDVTHTGITKRKFLRNIQKGQSFSLSDSELLLSAHGSVDFKNEFLTMVNAVERIHLLHRCVRRNCICCSSVSQDPDESMEKDKEGLDEMHRRVASLPKSCRDSAKSDRVILVQSIEDSVATDNPEDEDSSSSACELEIDKESISTKKDSHFYDLYNGTIELNKKESHLGVSTSTSCHSSEDCSIELKSSEKERYLGVKSSASYRSYGKEPLNIDASRASQFYDLKNCSIEINTPDTDRDLGMFSAASVDSSEDSYSGFGVSTELRRNLLEHLSVFQGSSVSSALNIDNSSDILSTSDTGRVDGIGKQLDDAIDIGTYNGECQKVDELSGGENRKPVSHFVEIKREITPYTSSISIDDSYCGFGVTQQYRSDLLHSLHKFQILENTSNHDDINVGQKYNDECKHAVHHRPKRYVSSLAFHVQACERNYVSVVCHIPCHSTFTLCVVHDQLKEKKTAIGQIYQVEEDEDVTSSDDDNFQLTDEERLHMLDDEVDDDGIFTKDNQFHVDGIGLKHGQVGVKNNFQIWADSDITGSPTVAIYGPRPHCVTETCVVYTGDNLYEVIYEVTHPGSYVISVKWCDFDVPDSPFLCQVTY